MGAKHTPPFFFFEQNGGFFRGETFLIKLFLGKIVKFSPLKRPSACRSESLFFLGTSTCKRGLNPSGEKGHIPWFPAKKSLLRKRGWGFLFFKLTVTFGVLGGVGGSKESFSLGVPPFFKLGGPGGSPSPPGFRGGFPPGKAIRGFGLFPPLSPWGLFYFPPGGGLGAPGSSSHSEGGP